MKHFEERDYSGTKPGSIKVSQPFDKDFSFLKKTGFKFRDLGGTTFVRCVHIKFKLSSPYFITSIN